MRFQLVLLSFVALPVIASAEVTPNGTYQSRVAIDVPAFRGIEPAIAITYDSSLGTGPVGVGWRLAAGSTITRMGETFGVPRYDTTDGFLLDGGELVTCPQSSTAPSCKTGGTHVARIDTFQRIRLANDVWTIWDRDGKKLTYTAQLRVGMGPADTYRWALTRVEDTHGDVATYDYSCGQGQDCVPSAIKWGTGQYCGTGLETPPDSQPTLPGAILNGGEVIFHWQSRTDVGERGTGRSLLSSPNLLRSIEVRSAGRVYRVYTFDYDTTGSVTRAAQLREVKTYGAETRVALGVVVASTAQLPTLTFETESMTRASGAWGTATHTLESNANAELPWPLPGPEYDLTRTRTDSRGDGLMKLRWLPGDVNGDALTDYILIGGVQIGAAIARRNGTFEYFVDTWAGKGWEGNTRVDPQDNVHAYIADFDGDGRGDIMQAFDAFYCDSHCPCNGGSICRHTAFRVAKFKNDGTWDYYQHDTTWPYNTNHTWSATIGYNVSLAIPLGPVSASTSIASGTIWHSSSTWLQDNWYVGDYDADGRTDFMGISAYDRTLPGGGTEKAVRLRSVRSLGDTVATSEVITNTDWSWNDNHVKNSRFFVGDHDGDRRSDFMVVNYLEGPRTVGFSTGRSNGDGTFSTRTVPTSKTWATDDQWLPADTDGDGRTDFLHVIFRRPTQTVRIDHAAVEAATSDGEGNYTFGTTFEIPEQWHFPGPCVGNWAHTPWMIGDVDGDGRSDLVHPHVDHDYDCAKEEPLRAGRILKASVIYSRPGGTFSRRSTPLHMTTWLPECGQEVTMAMGDVNGDGRDDFIYGDSVPNIKSGCLPQNWELEVKPSPRDPADTASWISADFNGDGRQDLYYVAFTNPGYRVYTLIANAAGDYDRAEYPVAPSTTVTGLDHPGAARWMARDVASFTGLPDGRDDLIFIDELPDQDRVTITTLVSYGTGQFAPRQDTIADTAGGLDLSVAPWLPADIDGDGFGDFVHVTDIQGTRIDALRSRGDGTFEWVFDTYSLAGLDLRDTTTWRVIDHNGDGRSDLVYVRRDGANSAIVMTGEGDGTFVSNGAPMPTAFVDVHGWRPAELNGDGLTDLVYLQELRHAVGFSLVVHSVIARGDGTFEYRASGQLPITGVTLHDRVNFRVFDVDGDGRSELVHVGTVRTPGTQTVVSTLWNRHDGWDLEVSSALPFAFTDSRSWRIMDEDADTTPDFVYVTSDLHVLRPDVASDRLRHERNGIGGEIEVSYKSSAGAHAYMPFGPIPVVDQISVRENVVEQGIVSTERYTYAGGRWSIARRDSLGFATVTRSDGLALGISRYEQTDACGVRPMTQEKRDTAGMLFHSKHLQFVDPSASGQAPFVCLPWIDENYECERSAPCRLTRTIHEYDDWGNEVRTTELGDVLDDTDDKLTETPVNAFWDARDYVVALPTHRKSYETDGNGNWRQLAATDFLYDGATTAGQPPGRHGDLTSIEAWDSTSGNPVASKFTYDAHGSIIRAEGPPTPHAPDGTHETYGYDCTFALYPVSRCNAKYCELSTWDLALGVKTSDTDANMATTTYDHDGFGRVTRTDFADTSFATTTYPHPATWGQPGQAVREEHSDESPIDGVLSRELSLDGLGRVTSIVDEDGTIALIGYYRATSHIRRKSAPFSPPLPALWTTTDFDELGRPIRATLPDNSVHRATITKGMVSERDPMGGTISYVQDAFGRTRQVIELLQSCPVGVTECAGRSVITTYAYDGLDRMIGIEDALGNVSTAEWNSLERRTRVCDPDSGCWDYEYNADGTLARERDANGASIDLSYDNLGRATEKRYVDLGGLVSRTVAYVWDVDPYTGAASGASMGRLVRIKDRGANVEIDDVSEYDVLGRERRHERCLDRRCMEWAMELDLAGRLRRLKYPDATGKVSPSSEIVEHVYADTGRLYSMPGLVDEIAHDQAGRLQNVRFANGAVEDYVVDPARSFLLVKDITDKSGAKLHLTYAYDRKGRVTRHTADNGPGMWADYWYDSLDRLRVVTASDAVYARQFEYDDIGRMTFDARHGAYRYTDPRHVHAVTETDAGHQRRYDKRGNLVISERLSLQWNGDGMPTTITNSVSHVTTEHGYDASGQRVKRTTPAGSTYYFSPILEVDPSGDVIKIYKMGDRTIARRKGTGGLVYFHEDLGGSVRLMTDHNGDAQNRYEYGAFGDSISSHEPIDNDLGFAGQIDDDATRLRYMNARFYDPELGAFISADTVIPALFNPQSLNRYSFGFNSPTNYSDPSGHRPMKNAATHASTHAITHKVHRAHRPSVCVELCATFKRPPKPQAPKPAQRTGSSPDEWDLPMTPPPLVEAPPPNRTVTNPEYRNVPDGNGVEAVEASPAGQPSGVRIEPEDHAGVFLLSAPLPGWEFFVNHEKRNPGADYQDWYDNDYRHWDKTESTGEMLDLFVCPECRLAGGVVRGVSLAAQITRNRIAGKLFEREVARGFRLIGMDVWTTKTTLRTALGFRFSDMHVGYNGMKLFTVEAKLGSSEYLGLQQGKDALIWFQQGLPTFLIRGQTTKTGQRAISISINPAAGIKR